MRRLSELLVELGAGGFDHGLQDLLAQVRGKVDNMSKASFGACLAWHR